MNFLVFIFVLGLLVLFHEFGHFIFAKIFSVRVEEFAFGFPPKLWSKKIGETTYAINLVPFGGYVKLYGETGEGNKKDKKNFVNKKAWQKIIILGAGVVMNWVLAYLIFSVFYLWGGRPILPGAENHPFIIDTRKVVVRNVVEGSPASQAGIKAGSLVYKVEGVDVKNTGDVVSLIQKKASVDKGAQITIDFQENGKLITKKMPVYQESQVDGKSFYRVGLIMEEGGKVKSVWWAVPYVAFMETGRIIKVTLISFADTLRDSFKTGRLSDQLGGPVAIYVVTGSAAKAGFGILMQIVAVLSITLAILNILPFPALDGGHILFISLERILGRSISERLKHTINFLGFCLLLIMIILVTFNDLTRFGILESLKGWLK